MYRLHIGRLRSPLGDLPEYARRAADMPRGEPRDFPLPFDFDRARDGLRPPLPLPLLEDRREDRPLEREPDREDRLEPDWRRFLPLRGVRGRPLGRDGDLDLDLPLSLPRLLPFPPPLALEERGVPLPPWVLPLGDFFVLGLLPLSLSSCSHGQASPRGQEP